MVYQEYARVNAAVNDVFFDGRFNAKPVYIDLEEGAATELAAKLGVKTNELETLIALAVQETLDAGYDPYAWHRAGTRTWIRSGRQAPPPFTGLLMALSLAADKMREDGQFSATNYYERLFEVLDIESPALRSRLRMNARATRLFWRELNHWLTEHDFQLGRPTARQVNSWPYVSYALSQALVRDADRACFQHLFKEFDLSPIDEVSESEMVLFLHDWMTGAGPNRWLKKLWSTADIRERIAAAALTELEHWDGGQQEGGYKKRRLGWTAYLKTFPRRRLDLLLATMGTEEKDEILLTISPGASPATRQALAEIQGQPRLLAAPTGDFSILEPTREIDLCSLLVASFELAREDGDTYGHVARPIVPLAKLDAGLFFREVQRVTLLRRHAVLCHEQWADKVRHHLDLCARPGFKCATSAELPGLPPEWVFFEDVEITRVLDNANQNLAILVPLSEGVAIQLEGGLKLAPQIWHSAAPPSILATSDSGAFRLVVRSDAADDDANLFDVPSRGGSCSIKLDEMSRLATELSAVAVRSGNEKGERNFALRDAATPRPVREGWLRHGLGGRNPLAFLSATLEGEAIEAAVLGMHVEGAAANDPEADEISLRFAEQAPEGDRLDHEYRFANAGGLAETCMIRGHHYWICEPAKKGDIPWEAKRMDCRDCRDRVILRNRVRRKQAPSFARGRLGSTSVATPPVEDVAPVSLDLVFDGACYLGAGSWGSLQSLAAAHSNDPWFAARLARDLHDLGHVDFQRDSAGRATSWTVAPPVLVVTDAGEAYLSGFRNRALVDAVGDALEAIECEYAPGEVSSGLAREGWLGVDMGAAAAALAGVVDPHGREVIVGAPPATAIAAEGPVLDALLSVMKPVHLEGQDGLQRFEPREGRWKFTSESNAPGAYRVNFAGRRYFVRLANGESRATNHSLAKIFAARAEGVALHGYDPARQRLFGALGCDLPGLYSRAAVSCSGYLPLKEGQRFYHADVPPGVARRILSNLYRTS